MDITFAETLAEAEEQVIISISLEEGEFLAIGDKLDIEMVDGTHTVHSVFSMSQWNFPKNDMCGKLVAIERFDGKGSCEVVADHIYSGRIQTTSMLSREERSR